MTASNARICWNDGATEICVSRYDKPEPKESQKLENSGGACVMKWAEISQNEESAAMLLFMMYYDLTQMGFNPNIVNEAFSKIVEWDSVWGNSKFNWQS